MPKRAKELSAIEVKRLGVGVHAVGGVPGLYLQVTGTHGRSWLLRTPVGGRRREIGLGPYPGVSLKEARTSGAELKAQIRQGIDPVRERRELKRKLVAETKKEVLFRDAFELFVPIKLNGLADGTYRKNWRNSVDQYAMPILGGMRVSEIEINDIANVLEPIWISKYSTAEKLRIKLHETLEFCAGKEFREDRNPARWKGRLSNVLKKPANGSDTEKYPAVKLSDLHRCWRGIGQRQGVSALALRFQILTACRTGAVRFMTWSELDFSKNIWTVQPLRKSSKISIEMGPRRVPLTPTMISLLGQLPKFESSPYVFTAPRGGALSDASISKVLKKTHESDLEAGGGGFRDARTGKAAVPHGFRSTFKDWVLERTSYEWNLSEIALWHFMGTKVERAYARSDLIEKRREMMTEWGEFIQNGAELYEVP